MSSRGRRVFVGGLVPTVLAALGTFGAYDGHAHNPATMKGKGVIVDLMAAWCVPCIAQMKHFNTVRDAYAEEDVMILRSDTDRRESVGQIERWMKQNNARWPYAFDADGVSQKLKLKIPPRSS